jgi:hypothetical protein
MFVFFFKSQSSMKCEICADFVGQCRFSWFLVSLSFSGMITIWTDLKNCYLQITVPIIRLGWVTLRFSVHMTRDFFCQLPRKWWSIDSTVGHLPYNSLIEALKALDFLQRQNTDQFYSFPLISVESQQKWHFFSIIRLLRVL